jgi:hypothetical protein
MRAIERLAYLRFVDNWHKWPPLARLLCKIGRHDYEAERVQVWLRATDLYCFYCGHRKRSFHVNEGRGLE